MKRKPRAAAVIAKARTTQMRTLAERDRKATDYDRLASVVDALLNHCPDMECAECGVIMCPHKDPMHFHHDGCPSCAIHS